MSQINPASFCIMQKQMNLKLLVKMNCLQLLFKKGRADLATGKKKKKRNPISREQALESLRLVEPQTWAREEGKCIYISNNQGLR